MDLITRLQRNKRLKKILIFALAVIFAIAVSVSLYLVYGRHPERVHELKQYVYLGAFLISIIGNATIFLPGAVLVILVNMSIWLYLTTGLSGPIMIGLAGAAGAAIGEITGYVLGYGGRAVVENSRLYQRLVGGVSKWGVPTIFVLSLIPLFFDLAGIAAGALRFPLWKFMVLCWLGRTLLYTGICLASVFGYRILVPFFS